MNETYKQDGASHPLVPALALGLERGSESVHEVVLLGGYVQLTVEFVDAVTEMLHLCEEGGEWGSREQQVRNADSEFIGQLLTRAAVALEGLDYLLLEFEFAITHEEYLSTCSCGPATRRPGCGSAFR